MYSVSILRLNETHHLVEEAACVEFLRPVCTRISKKLTGYLRHRTRQVLTPDTSAQALFRVLETVLKPPMSASVSVIIHSDETGYA